MPYNTLLNQLIDKSGMTAKDIAEQCNQQGQKITASYISILRKAENNRTPSDDVSRALAKALNADEDSLVLEAYLDNAPEVMKAAFRNMYLVTIEMTMGLLGSKITDEQREAAKQMINNVPLYEMIKQLSQQQQLSQMNQNILYKNEQTDSGDINLSMQVNPEFNVDNEAMEPILHKESRVKISFQDKCKNGDIVAFTYDGESGVHYRKLKITADGKHMLIAYNSDFDIIEYDDSTMKLIGRVEAVTTKL